MATYEMEASPAPETKDESKKISFRFCREWYVDFILLPS